LNHLKFTWYNYIFIWILLFTFIGILHSTFSDYMARYPVAMHGYFKLTLENAKEEISEAHIPYVLKYKTF
jgi:hypothetical protein